MRGSFAVAAVAVSGVLVTTEAAAVAVPAPGPDSVTRTCSRDVDGQLLRVRVTQVYSAESKGDLDLSRVRVRATDNGERGVFRDADVNVRDIRVKVVSSTGRTTVNRTSDRSPFAVALDPAGNGRSIVRVKGTVRFRLPGGAHATLWCALISAPSA